MTKDYHITPEQAVLTVAEVSQDEIDFGSIKATTAWNKRDQLAIKEKDDAVREALEKAADLCDDMVLYTGLDCANAIRALIEPKD